LVRVNFFPLRRYGCFAVASIDLRRLVAVRHGTMTAREKSETIEGPEAEDAGIWIEPLMARQVQAEKREIGKQGWKKWRKKWLKKNVLWFVDICTNRYLWLKKKEERKGVIRFASSKHSQKSKLLEKKMEEKEKRNPRSCWEYSSRARLSMLSPSKNSSLQTVFFCTNSS
jgi:hypothetical protein